VKADWTPSGGGATNLGDDANKYTMELEQLGLASIVQVDPLYGSTTPFIAARGNNQGECIFASAKSFASIDAGAQDSASKIALIGASGSLVLTFNAHTLTMNATLRDARRVVSEDARGVRWKLRYTFEITTMTYA
jgi:hypothetical protein